jgi:quercetin dioxygenase-like cupin family protein
MMRSIVLLAAALIVAPALSAQAPQPTGGSPWVLVPPFFARGALISLISGDPNNPSDLNVQLSFPDRYRMRPHSHPHPLHVTVLQGALQVGVGKRFDLKQTRIMAVGDTGTVPANVPYYYVAKGWTIIDARTRGPFQLTYIDPADDPSRSTPFGR